MKATIRSWVSLFPAVALGLFAPGCASRSSSLPVYDSSEVGQVTTAELGTVDHVVAVIIEGDVGQTRSLGQSAGSSIGRSIAIGGDPVQAVAGAAGSVVGGLAGRSVEQNLRRREGQLVTVILDSGDYIEVVQENDPPFVGNERVRIIHKGALVEIVPVIAERPF